MSIHVNTYILKEFVHFQQETVIIYNKNNKILHTHTHKLYRETDLQLWLRKPRLPGVNRWAQGQYAPHRKAPPGGFEPRIILVWNQTKQTKNNNKKGQSLLHLVQFKHVESLLITYRQEAFKCSYSNRK